MKADLSSLIFLFFSYHKLYQGAGWPPVTCKNGMRLAATRKLIICRVAASRTQIVPKWRLVACKFPLKILRGDWDWRPRWYSSYVTGKYSSTICMQLAASSMYFLHTIAASTVQSHRFLENTLPIIWIKMNTSLKDLRSNATHVLAHNVWADPILWDGSFKSGSKAIVQ